MQTSACCRICQTATTRTSRRGALRISPTPGWSCASHSGALVIICSVSLCVAPVPCSFCFSASCCSLRGASAPRQHQNCQCLLCLISNVAMRSARPLSSSAGKSTWTCLLLRPRVDFLASCVKHRMRDSHPPVPSAPQQLPHLDTDGLLWPVFWRGAHSGQQPVQLLPAGVRQVSHRRRQLCRWACVADLRRHPESTSGVSCALSGCKPAWACACARLSPCLHTARGPPHNL